MKYGPRVVQGSVANATQAVTVAKVYGSSMVLDVRHANSANAISETVDVSRSMMHKRSPWLGDGRLAVGQAVAKSVAEGSWVDGGDSRAWLVGNCVYTIRRSRPVASDSRAWLIGDGAGTVGGTRLNSGDSRAWLVSDGVDVVGGAWPVGGYSRPWLVGNSADAVG